MGISELDAAPFGQINLFVGNLNCGKNHFPFVKVT
jgi:hypothetical protein